MNPESGERKFLHDLATPIGTALFVSDMLTEETNLSANALEIVKMLMLALTTAKSILDDRRLYLKSVQSTMK